MLPRLGCFSGDSVTFPVTNDCSTGKSSRLTSDLIVPNVNISVLLISTDDISIDLNGFSIIGFDCVGNPTLSCMPVLGSGAAVTSTSDQKGIAVSNGNIIGMGEHGINLTGDIMAIKEVKTRWNRQDGIHIGHSCVVINNISSENGGNGTSAFTGSTIVNNSLSTNNGDGIIVSLGSTISQNSLINNNGNGIQCINSCTVINNTITGVTQAGTSALVLSANSGYRGNIIDTAFQVTPVSGGVNLSGNLCNGSLSCN